MNGDTHGEAHGAALAGRAPELTPRAKLEAHLAQQAHGLPVTFTANEYLDARVPSFRDAERRGLVIYEPPLKLVRVTDPGIAAYLRAGDQR